jgi:hypothetical protein
MRTLLAALTAAADSAQAAHEDDGVAAQVLALLEKHPPLLITVLVIASVLFLVWVKQVVFGDREGDLFGWFTFGKKKADAAAPPTVVTTVNVTTSGPPAPPPPAAVVPPGTSLYSERARELFEWLKSRQKYRTLSLHWTLEIDSSFGVTVIIKRELAAVTHPLVALCSERRSTDTPLANFADLRLRVHDGAGTELVWIPTRDVDYEKHYIAFLREPLLPDGGTATIVMQSTWPNAAGKLRTIGLSDFQSFKLPEAAVGTIPNAGLEIKLPTTAGSFKVTCQDPLFDVDFPDATGNSAKRLELSGSQPGREIRLTIRRLN